MIPGLLIAIIMFIDYRPILKSQLSGGNNSFFSDLIAFTMAKTMARKIKFLFYNMLQISESHS